MAWNGDMAQAGKPIRQITMIGLPPRILAEIGIR
jgi:hypothetical protein